MTLAPRFLVEFLAGYRARRFVRRLKAQGLGLAAQKAAFKQLMAQFDGTEFGQQHSLRASTTYEQFRDSVPPRTYDYFQPLVQRMTTGAAGVLLPGTCHFFVETAGTMGRKPKLIPVPDSMLQQYRGGLYAALFLYITRVGSPGVFLGRHLHTGPSTIIKEEAGAYFTSLDGILTFSLSPWVEANLRSPPLDVDYLPEGPVKLTETVQAMRTSDVTLVAGAPAAACALALACREAAAAGAEEAPPHLQALWPNLECLLFSGAPVGLYTDALRLWLGPSVNLHEVYAAAEGVFAVQDDAEPAALRLLTDTGIFYEFLPLRDYNEKTFANDREFCRPLEQVKPDVDYVVIITTPAGLCRYVVGDIVRFVSVDPPRLLFIGRTGCQLNSFGEHVTERELAETLLTVCARNGWQAVNFHVAPYQRRVAAGQIISCHEWWLELGTHTIKTPTANVLAPELDAELARHNSDYAARRSARTVDLPSVRLVMPGMFEQWALGQGKASSTSKMQRCRSDRNIADQLATLARFHPETET